MILTISRLIPALGGRRFIMTMGCGFVCAILVHNKDISDVVFQYIIIGTVGAYITGNVWESVAQKGKPDA